MIMTQEQRQRKPIDMKARRLVGARVRLARCEKGYGIDDLAQYLGVTKTTISNLEAGKHCLPAERIIALAQLLGKQPGWLLGDTT